MANTEDRQTETKDFYFTHMDINVRIMNTSDYKRPYGTQIFHMLEDV